MSMNFSLKTAFPVEVLAAKLSIVVRLSFEAGGKYTMRLENRKHFLPKILF